MCYTAANRGRLALVPLPSTFSSAYPFTDNFQFPQIEVPRCPSVNIITNITSTFLQHSLNHHRVHSDHFAGKWARGQFRIACHVNSLPCHVRSQRTRTKEKSWRSGRTRDCNRRKCAVSSCRVLYLFNYAPERDGHRCSENTYAEKSSLSRSDCRCVFEHLPGTSCQFATFSSQRPHMAICSIAVHWLFEAPP